jgi:hypothetical protein
VFESVTERRILQHIAPHLVNPLGFLFPVYPQSRYSPFVVNIGMWLYDGLSLFRSPRVHRNLTRDEALEEEPRLRRQGLRGAPLYWTARPTTRASRSRRPSTRLIAARSSRRTARSSRLRTTSKDASWARGCATC